MADCAAAEGEGTVVLSLRREGGRRIWRWEQAAAMAWEMRSFG